MAPGFLTFDAASDETLHRTQEQNSTTMNVHLSHVLRLLHRKEGGDQRDKEVRLNDMGDRPTLARDIYAKYVAEDGEVAWPEDAQGCALLARTLYGKQLVGTLDYWLSHAIDLVEKPGPAEPFRRRNEAYKQDKYFRDKFSALSAEQKLAVRHLVYTVAHGILFSLLVDIDQGDYGDYLFTLTPRGDQDEVRAVPIAPGRPHDLHDELNDWILRFSRFANELVELSQVKGGWQLGVKSFYFA